MANMKQKGLTSESSREKLSSNDSEQPQTSLASEIYQNIKDQQQRKENVMIDIRDGDLMPPSIYRVPPMIRKLKEDAYTPMAVSIGPFHQRDEQLQEMEKHKKALFIKFIQKYKPNLDDMVKFVKDSVPKVQASYSENIELDEKDLVQLVLVDAVFIIQFFIRMKFDDAKLSLPTYLQEIIIRDLVLLENQLPFFIIEDLFNIAFPPNPRCNPSSFLELTYDFFEDYNKEKLEPNSNERIKHFTDLLRLFYLGGKKPEKDQHNEDIEPNHNVWAKYFTDLFRRLFCLQKDQLDNEDEDEDQKYLLYSAKELEEVGVKFKSIRKCLLDIKFSGHDLLIPKILVEDNTELLFRNVIALEQCLYFDEAYISGYAFLMDCLINTDKDVDVLIHKGILHYLLGDKNDVATLFNGLCKDIFTDLTTEHIKLCKSLNKFYKSHWHKMKATLRRDYCNTPWKTVATAVGIIVLILTTTQTILSLLPAILT